MRLINFVDILNKKREDEENLTKIFFNCCLINCLLIKEDETSIGKCKLEKVEGKWRLLFTLNREYQNILDGNEVEAIKKIAGKIKSFDG